MRIAFSSNGLSLDSPFEPRFGRCPNFLIYDTDNDSCTVVDNIQNNQAAHGAGISSATMLSSEKVDAIVTGHPGPKASQALRAAGIAIYDCEAATCRDALELFQSGALRRTDGSGAR